jgi:CHASE1-domain containing sensor protein
MAVFSLACAGRRSQAPGTPYLTVFVSRDGVISADRQEVSLSRLGEELDRAKAANAVILFASEPSERGRAGHAPLVLRAIQVRGLKLRVCAQPGCSDAIGPEGRLRPE